MVLSAAEKLATPDASSFGGMVPYYLSGRVEPLFTNLSYSRNPLQRKDPRKD
jgi:hypothetical protein